jgi:hypothetical protein
METLEAQATTKDTQSRKPDHIVTVGEARVKMTVEIDGVEGIRADALSRIYMVMRREAERFSQIVYVDARDQIIERKEAQRIAKLPKDRSSVIVAAGSKDPASVFVVRGTIKAAGRTLKAEK